MANFINYINETIEELVHRVSWPTWKELQNNTIIVVVASILISLIIFVMDYVAGIVPSNGGFWKGVLGFIYSGF
ncbi:MAG TPA: preprotein translocase subunit SecE [Taishania sp.]|nr:preprotein translocase subunit SecE [Taishania sp.]